MKHLIGLIILGFVSYMGFRIGGELSSDAFGMAIGMLFGIMAGIPTALRVDEEPWLRDVTREIGVVGEPGAGGAHGLSSEGFEGLEYDSERASARAASNVLKNAR